MTVSTGSYLQGIYSAVKAQGEKAISSDAMLEFEGFESMALLVKGFPWPMLSPGDAIPIPTPLGGESWKPSQVKVNQQGQVQMLETTAGTISNTLLLMIAQGGIFNAKMYEGTTDRYHRGIYLKDCMFQVEPGERDWENRSSVLIINGTLSYHYFGESFPGNI